MAILTAAQVAGYASRAGFTGEDLHIIVAIAEAESGFDTTAHNPGGAGDVENSYGLWQINLDAHPEVTVGQAEDPTFAAGYAYKLFKDRGGFGDWGTYNTGRYKEMPSWAQPPTTSAGSPLAWTPAQSLAVWPWLTDNGVTPKINNPYHSSFEAGRGATQDGVGLAVPLDTEITSLTAGVVMAAAYGTDFNAAWNYGGFIVVRSQIPGLANADVFYRHMDTITVKKGDTVKVGQPLGLSGGQVQGGEHPESTTFTTGPHIDVGINPATLPYTSAGANVDPTSWLNGLLKNGPPVRDALGIQGIGGVQGTALGSGAQKLVALSDMVAQGTGPVADSFGAIEARLDYSMSFIPIDWATLSKSTHWWDFVLPWQWQQTTETITANVAGAIFHNASALAMRGLFILIGLLMLIGFMVAVNRAIITSVVNEDEAKQFANVALAAA